MDTSAEKTSRCHAHLCLGQWRHSDRMLSNPLLLIAGLQCNSFLHISKPASLVTFKYDSLSYPLSTSGNIFVTDHKKKKKKPKLSANTASLLEVQAHLG